MTLESQVAQFSSGFSVPELSPYLALDPVERHVVKKAIQAARKDLEAAGATVTIEVDPITRQADPSILRARLDAHIAAVDTDLKSGAPFAGGVEYVWRNGAWVCIQTFVLLESVGGVWQPSVYAGSTSLGPISIPYWVSLDWPTEA